MTLILFSDIIIPALTLFLARGTNWFSTNFSSIRHMLSRQTEFFIWSMITGGYFYLSMRSLIKRRASVHNIKKELFLFLASAWLMVLFVVTPYIPSKFPLISCIHVVSAISSCILFFLCLLSLVCEGYYRNPKRYRSCLAVLSVNTVFCICSFLVTGIINSSMEICFVFACSFLLKQLSQLDPLLSFPSESSNHIINKANVQ